MAAKKAPAKGAKGTPASKAGSAKKLGGFLAQLGAFKPASEVLTSVRAVPTWFPQFNRATRVGGWPLNRFGMVHGESHGGKTRFVLGLIGSFLALGHRAHFVDLERTTPIDWVRQDLGALAESPKFTAAKIDTLEQARDSVRIFLEAIIGAKKCGELDRDDAALIVLDSIDKLIPKDQFDVLHKATDVSKVGMDGMKGRGAQRKAMLVKCWLDELIPLLDKAGAAMIIVARETKDPNADPWKAKFGQDFKVSGGSHAYYDSSLVIRVSPAGMLVDERGDGPPRFLGERHKLTIRKSKVAGKDGRDSVCFFHTSNGAIAPVGFDRVRDFLDLGVELGIVEHNCEKEADRNKGNRTIPGIKKSMNVHDFVAHLSKPESADDLAVLVDLVRGAA